MESAFPGFSLRDPGQRSAVRSLMASPSKSVSQSSEQVSLKVASTSFVGTKTMTLTLKTGKYTFYCAVHGPTQTTEIEVKPEDGVTYKTAFIGTPIKHDLSSTPVTGKDGKRGDQLVSLEVDLPADDAELRSFAESWSGGGNPRAGLGV